MTKSLKLINGLARHGVGVWTICQIIIYRGESRKFDIILTNMAFLRYYFINTRYNKEKYRSIEKNTDGRELDKFSKNN